MNFNEFIMRVMNEADEEMFQEYDSVLKNLKFEKVNKKETEKNKKKGEEKTMKLYCIVPEQVNLKEIDNAIMRQSNAKYIIMSSKTFGKVFPNKSRSLDNSTSYHGVPVAICDSLEYGVFEVI